MTTPTDVPMSGQSSCWCCGNAFPESGLVRLGSHPEVGVCLDCAKYLNRRAREQRDEVDRPVSRRLRAPVRAARAAVISRGWHEHSVVGRWLRRIDRFLP